MTVRSGRGKIKPGNFCCAFVLIINWTRYLVFSLISVREGEQLDGVRLPGIIKSKIKKNKSVADVWLVMLKRHYFLGSIFAS